LANSFTVASLFGCGSQAALLSRARLLKSVLFNFTAGTFEEMFVLKKKVSTEDALAQRWVLAQRVGMLLGYFAALRVVAFVSTR